MTDLDKTGIPLNSSELNNVSGGKIPSKRATCPRCKQQTLVIKYKRLECLHCGYVENM